MNWRKPTQILLMVILAFCSLQGFTSELCGDVFAANGDRWRPTAGTVFEAFRANAPFFWNWSKNHASQFISEKRLTLGIVMGDPHILNIADSVINLQRKFVLIDVDDGGEAPFILDFVRLALGDLLSENKIGFDQLWLAYVMGLSGREYFPPSILSRALNRSWRSENEMRQKGLKKWTNDDHTRFNFEKTSALPMDNMDECTREKYEKAKKAIRRALGDSEILDQGFLIKTTGGSQGLERFWFLVNDDGDTKIVEFKRLGNPAVAEYKSQPISRRRLDVLTEIYRDGENDSDFSVIEAGEADYLKRIREKRFLDFDPSKIDSSDISDYLEMVEYIANWMGVRQARQNQGQLFREALIGVNGQEAVQAKAEVQSMVNELKKIHLQKIRQY